MAGSSSHLQPSVHSQCSTHCPGVLGFQEKREGGSRVRHGGRAADRDRRSENWKPDGWGGRGTQSQAGRPGLGWMLGSSAAGRKTGIWVGNREAGAAGGGAGSLPALSVVLKRRPSGSTVLARTPPPPGTPLGTSGAAWGKAMHGPVACRRGADVKHPHLLSLGSI